MSIDSDNIMRLHENIKTVNAKVEELTVKLAKLEGTVAMLKTEATQNKYYAQALSRGTGSTT